MNLRFLSLAFLSLFAACGGGADAGQKATELRFSVIPDFNKAKLAETGKMLADHLTEKLGTPVRYEPSTDYTAAVTGLVNNKLDFVWLGGKTTVDALDQGQGHVRVLATRDIDLDFKTYFIANQSLLADGRVSPMDSLDGLKEAAKDLTFTFGDVNSTSGHLMPRYFLVQSGINPDEAFKSMGYQASGGHGATLKAVASGASDVGALNFGYWDKASDADKKAAPIIYTTPGYVDYAWVGHDRIGDEMLQRITDAFTSLDGNNAKDKAILDAWSAKAKFLPADGARWNSIRQVRDSLPEDFLK